MRTLTVTAQGQITLRRELLRHLRILPGRQVTGDKRANGVLALHAEAPHGQEGSVGGLSSRTPATAAHPPR